jgi:hypothetical protein
MTPKLTNDIEQAVEQNHGFVQLQGQRSAYVVMSLDAYREMMGVGSDAELAESLQAVHQGLADIEAGRTRPFRDVIAELG